MNDSDTLPQDSAAMPPASTGSVANHAAVPAAIARVGSVVPPQTAHGGSVRTDKAEPLPVDGTGDTPDGHRYAGWPHPTGTPCEVSEAEIDALEYIVVKGRVAADRDEDILRQWLIRLRPAFDSAKPIKCARCARSK